MTTYYATTSLGSDVRIIASAPTMAEAEAAATAWITNRVAPGVDTETALRNLRVDSAARLAEARGHRWLDAQTEGYLYERANR